MKEYLKTKEEQSIDTKLVPLDKELKGVKDSYVEKLMDSSKRFNKKDV